MSGLRKETSKSRRPIRDGDFLLFRFEI